MPSVIERTMAVEAAAHRVTGPSTVPSRSKHPHLPPVVRGAFLGARCPLDRGAIRNVLLSGGGSGAGRVAGQDAELVALGIGERNPAAAIGPPVVGELRRGGDLSPRKVTSVAGSTVTPSRESAVSTLAEMTRLVGMGHAGPPGELLGRHPASVAVPSCGGAGGSGGVASLLVEARRFFISSLVPAICFSMKS